jgi:hypothetical protein
MDFVFIGLLLGLAGLTALLVHLVDRLRDTQPERR